MKTLDNPGEVENDALQTAINTSNDSAYVRGVKRLCVEPGDSEDRVLEHNPSRPFLETKWESEASRKRRELVVDVWSLVCVDSGPQENYPTRLSTSSTTLCKALREILQSSLKNKSA